MRHTPITGERKWKQEWKGAIIFAHGKYNARGIAILIPEYLINDIYITNCIIDDNGRYFFLKCKIFTTEIVLTNLYCPTRDKIRAPKKSDIF